MNPRLKYMHTLIEKNLDKASVNHHIDNDCYINTNESLNLIMNKCCLSENEIKSFLFIATRTGKNVSLRGILESGINSNCLDENGETPLHFAVRRGDSHQVNILLEYGADPFLQNKRGLNAIAYSIKKPEIYSLFEKNYFLLNEGLGSVFLMMYEQAIQANNDDIARKFLKFAVLLKEETAIRIYENFNNPQKDKSVKPNVYSLFQQPLALDNKELKLQSPDLS